MKNITKEMSVDLREYLQTQNLVLNICIDKLRKAIEEMEYQRDLLKEKFIDPEEDEGFKEEEQAEADINYYGLRN